MIKQAGQQAWSFLTRKDRVSEKRIAELLRNWTADPDPSGLRDRQADDPAGGPSKPRGKRRYLRVLNEDFNLQELFEILKARRLSIVFPQLSWRARLSSFCQVDVGKSSLSHLFVIHTLVQFSREGG